VPFVGRRVAHASRCRKSALVRVATRRRVLTAWRARGMRATPYRSRARVRVAIRPRAHTAWATERALTNHSSSGTPSEQDYEAESPPCAAGAAAE
jgi:hypothetical protein